MGFFQSLKRPSSVWRWSFFLVGAHVLLFCSGLYSQDLSLQDLSQSAQWIKLGHYRQNLFGDWKSEVDGPSFFMDQTGKFDPLVELEASYRKLILENNKELQCQFPARFLWLKKQAHFRGDLSHCEDYQFFKKRLPAKSVSLVFSSYYINNPSSSFGHTFLKFNLEKKNQDGKPIEFLDMAIDFAAKVDSKNAMVYAFKGVFGFFRGEFSLMPYFVKVKKYNGFESRDLWTYELELSEEQIELLVAHLWEMGHTHMDYYYLDENCSYHILSAIEVARPEFDLRASQSYFVVLPSDTLKAVVAAEGLVRKISYRPSSRERWLFREESLGLQERAVLNQSVRSVDDQIIENSNLSESRKAHIIDTAVEFLDFKHPYEMQDLQHFYSLYKSRLLKQRNQLKYPSASLKEISIDKDKPHEGHGSSRTQLTYIYDDAFGSYVGLGYRLALHDLLDPQISYPDYAEIEFLDIQAGAFVDSNKFWLRDLSLVKIRSLSPLLALDKPFSWQLRVGANHMNDETCHGCLAGVFDFAAGWTFELQESKKIRSFFLLATELGVSPEFSKTASRFGVGPMAGLSARPFQWWQLLTEAQFQHFVALRNKNEWKLSAESRFHIADSLSFGVSANKRKHDYEIGGSAFVYF